jgi:hypothetical protein
VALILALLPLVGILNVPAGPSHPVAGPTTDVDISAAVPMSEPAGLPPPSIDDLGTVTTDSPIGAMSPVPAKSGSQSQNPSTEAADPLPPAPVDPVLVVPPLPPPIEIGGRSQPDGVYIPSGPADAIGRVGMDLQGHDSAIRVQERLIELGFLRGNADGVWGPRSRIALSEFRRASGLQADGLWDRIIEELIFSDKAPHAKPFVEPTFAGGWALRSSDCFKGTDGKAPAIITEKRAEAFGGICTFNSVQRVTDGWMAQAVCTVNNQSWNSNIKLEVNGNKLSWSSEKGSQIYVRCTAP